MLVLFIVKFKHAGNINSIFSSFHFQAKAYAKSLSYQWMTQSRKIRAPPCESPNRALFGAVTFNTRAPLKFLHTHTITLTLALTQKASDVLTFRSQTPVVAAKRAKFGKSTRNRPGSTLGCPPGSGGGGPSFTSTQVLARVTRSAMEELEWEICAARRARVGGGELFF